jgi:voltage-gated potassium channel
MLAVVPDRRRWLREHLLEVLIVVGTPPFLPESLQALRLFRLLRLLRLVVLVKYARRVFSLDGLKVGALIAVTALAGGAGFAALEKGHSTWDGVWWAITTMTTVGYGDLSPATPAGRILGVFVMLVGIGFIALLTGAIAERFLASGVRQVEEDLTTELEDVEMDVLNELRDVTERLRRLEARVQHLARPR